MRNFKEKVKLLREFDESHNGTYTINDLSELIVEAYELGTKMRLTTDDSMVYGFATAYQTFDNLKFTPENANTILVERELLIELAQAREAVRRLYELRDRIYDMPTPEFGKYWLMDEFEEVLYGEQ